ncbi:MAG: Crp/Fnr family transcriptional regulator [Pseudomonadota bacterium]
MQLASQTIPAPEDTSVNDRLDEILQEISPFSDLPDAVRAALCENGVARRYAAGQTVFSIGQYDASEFFVVVSGLMKVAALDADSGAMMVEEVGPKTIFGLDIVMSGLTMDVVQQMAVTAESDLHVVMFDAEEFRALAGQRPSLMRNLADMFAKQLVTVRFRANTGQTAPEQRVYAVLLENIERDAVTNEWRIPRMPKHRELAERAGVDDSVAASAVASLIQESIARRDYPGLVITDMQGLTRLTR